jgi:FAD dependent oxidoreductase TIGR03364
MRIVVIGGGVLGTMHAWLAGRRGHQVVQLEREAVARGASVRNFGLIWVSGRAEGLELDAARRGRELWEGIARDVPGIGFRDAGSLTIARTDLEWDVAEAAAAMDSAKERGFELLGPDDVCARNPAVRGDIVGGLYSSEDAIVEPRVAVAALRDHLSASPSYRWVAGRDARRIDGGTVVDDHGDRYAADVVVVCPGAARGGLVAELRPEVPVRRVRLQMLQTAPFAERLTTAVANGDSFRYYPAYRGPALEALQRRQPQSALAERTGQQLLMVQRRGGGLTIGDTHAHGEPFDFDVAEDVYRELAAEASAILGRPLPAIERRWAGVYAQPLDTTELVHREEVRPGVWLVMGPGGRGMTCSPAIAEATWQAVGL